MSQTITDPYGAVRNGNDSLKRALPLGSITIRQRERKGDKTRLARYIKIRMDGLPGRRWILYACWWWKENHGPVPAGHIVIHKDGDELNDKPANLGLGTPGTKLALAHKRDAKWSHAQHGRAAAGCSEFNRRNGRINRAKNFLPRYWYPVVDTMSVILNVPFRSRKRLLACFGADVSQYPANGRGSRRDSYMQRTLSSLKVCPTRGREFFARQYSTFCLLEPASKDCRGPMGNLNQLIAQLDRMEIWTNAQKYAQKDLSERK